MRAVQAEAYRHAVDVSPRDYRAWYGLGQTYELVNMPYYALHYFRRWVRVRVLGFRVCMQVCVHGCVCMCGAGGAPW